MSPSNEYHRVGPFRAGDTCFTVETDSTDVADEVAVILRDLRSTSADQVLVTFTLERPGPHWLAHPWAVSRDGEICESSITDDYLIPYLLWEVTRLLLERSPDHVLLHGAAVAFEGGAIVLAGPSRSGKSTLAGWLTHRGWGYLTDEVAMVDPHERTVRPFWRPIGVRAGPLATLCDPPLSTSEGLLPASLLGSLSGPADLRAFVLPVYTPGGAREPRLVAPAAALAALTVHHPRLLGEGRAGFRRLADLAEKVPAYTLAVDDLDVAEGLLRRLVVRPHTE